MGGGGLNREGAYLNFWLRGEGLIREGALTDTGGWRNLRMRNIVFIHKVYTK